MTLKSTIKLILGAGVSMLVLAAGSSDCLNLRPARFHFGSISR